MIWDKLSPFYDFFETVYNGKCYKEIAKKIKEYVTEDDIVLECVNQTAGLHCRSISIGKRRTPSLRQNYSLHAV